MGPQSGRWSVHREVGVCGSPGPTGTAFGLSPRHLNPALAPRDLRPDRAIRACHAYWPSCWRVIRPKGVALMRSRVATARRLARTQGTFLQGSLSLWDGRRYEGLLQVTDGRLTGTKHDRAPLPNLRHGPAGRHSDVVTCLASCRLERLRLLWPLSGESDSRCETVRRWLIALIGVHGAAFGAV